MTQQQPTKRTLQLAEQYFQAMTQHLTDLTTGRTDTVLKLADIAHQLAVHPRYLSRVVLQVSGQSPCFHFELGLVQVAQTLLCRHDLSITDVAHRLGYDPSNFTKFFKKYAGQTPSVFKKSISGANR